MKLKKVVLYLGTFSSLSTLPLIASCVNSKKGDDEKANIDKAVKSVNADVLNKSARKASEVTNNEISFANFDKTKYDLEVKSLLPDDSKGKLIVRFVLKTKDQKVISDIWESTIDDFRVESSTEVLTAEELNNLLNMVSFSLVSTTDSIDDVISKQMSAFNINNLDSSKVEFELVKPIYKENDKAIIVFKVKDLKDVTNTSEQRKVEISFSSVNTLSATELTNLLNAIKIELKDSHTTADKAVELQLDAFNITGVDTTKVSFQLFNSITKSNNDILISFRVVDNLDSNNLSEVKDLTFPGYIEPLTVDTLNNELNNVNIELNTNVENIDINSFNVIYTNSRIMVNVKEFVRQDETHAGLKINLYDSLFTNVISNDKDIIIEVPSQEQIDFNNYLKGLQLAYDGDATLLNATDVELDKIKIQKNGTDLDNSYVVSNNHFVNADATEDEINEGFRLVNFTVTKGNLSNSLELRLNVNPSDKNIIIDQLEKVKEYDIVKSFEVAEILENKKNELIAAGADSSVELYFDYVDFKIYDKAYGEKDRIALFTNSNQLLRNTLLARSASYEKGERNLVNLKYDSINDKFFLEFYLGKYDRDDSQKRINKMVTKTIARPLVLISQSKLNQLAQYYKNEISYPNKENKEANDALVSELQTQNVPTNTTLNIVEIVPNNNEGTLLVKYTLSTSFDNKEITSNVVETTIEGFKISSLNQKLSEIDLSVEEKNITSDMLDVNNVKFLKNNVEYTFDSSINVVKSIVGFNKYLGTASVKVVLTKNNLNAEKEFEITGFNRVEFPLQTIVDGTKIKINDEIDKNQTAPSAIVKDNLILLNSDDQLLLDDVNIHVDSIELTPNNPEGKLAVTVNFSYKDDSSLKATKTYELDGLKVVQALSHEYMNNDVAKAAFDGTLFTFVGNEEDKQTLINYVKNNNLVTVNKNKDGVASIDKKQFAFIKVKESVNNYVKTHSKKNSIALFTPNGSWKGINIVEENNAIYLKFYLVLKNGSKDEENPIAIKLFDINES
ncbi:lipoprotein 17-related variable surface protein [Mycoplasmopsis lipofaciens]|uniref:lipoprotein 17-related variable surface protein n=1 Tax=Mycoplasmopsis lipofaciens TaxID=114884 RepID=UPI0004820F07|nr:lipoprotein 17-related variable surface protein [Mycoplasmopsis lipofaciens]